MLASSTWRRLAAAGLASQPALAALQSVNFDDNDSIKAAAKIVAEDLLSFYPPYRGATGWTIGILPGPPPAAPYYWWQGGAMWGTLLDYRHLTGDTDFDGLITEAMVHQAGERRDYNPRNWSASMGNDDQAFWGMSAMMAAETGFTNPPPDDPQWLSLVQAVVHSQMAPTRRVPEDDPTGCAWGLRWQVYFNNGYDYINTISSGCSMNMAARLGRYTGNNTYIEWAERTYDFVRGLKYIDDNYEVYDGAHTPDGCTLINKLTFSYNAAVIMQSIAYLYNVTDGAPKWRTELDSLLNRTIISFFVDDSPSSSPSPSPPASAGNGGIAYERNCESAVGGCNTDMRSFKGYLHRWMASTMKLAPYTEPVIMPVLRSSAAAALRTCTGGGNGRMCGFHWREGVFRGEPGAGEQMNVLGALLSTLPPSTYSPPLTNSTGGTSQGDYAAGTGGDGNPFEDSLSPITTADRAGAGVLTAMLAGGFLGTMAWLNWDQAFGPGIGLGLSGV